MQFCLRFLALCAATILFASLAVAQQDGSDNGERKRILDNYDVAPRAAQKVEKAEKAKTEKSPQAENLPVKRGQKSTRKKDAVLKSTAAATKGEGYWRGEEENPKPAPPPAPKIYSELHSNIDDSGKLVLTSDTIVVKPELKLVPTLKPFESSGNQQLDNIIQNAGRKYQIDPRLILEVIRQESGFRSQVMSNKGARGLMQLIPSTAARFGVFRVFDPAENIEGGTRYLRFLLDTFKGNVELALAGYNAGENAVIRNNFQIPPYRETRDYVRSITARYRSKYHQYVIERKEEIVVRQAPPITFSAEDGRVILSNNY